MRGSARIVLLCMSAWTVFAALEPSLTAPPQPGCPAGDPGVGLVPRTYEEVLTEPSLTVGLVPRPSLTGGLVPRTYERVCASTHQIRWRSCGPCRCHPRSADNRRNACDRERSGRHANKSRRPEMRTWFPVAHASPSELKRPREWYADRNPASPASAAHHSNSA